jgi:hypothetical protein
VPEKVLAPLTVWVAASVSTASLEPGKVKVVPSVPDRVADAMQFLGEGGRAIARSFAGCPLINVKIWSGTRSLIAH